MVAGFQFLVCLYFPRAAIADEPSLGLKLCSSEPFQLFNLDSLDPKLITPALGRLWQEVGKALTVEGHDGYRAKGQ